MKYKKLLRRAFLFSLVLIIITGNKPGASAYSNPNTTLRIGLYYDNDTLASANLEAKVGNGFEFGYFTSDRNFVSLGAISETKITMMKDLNMYLGSDYKYYDAEPQSIKDIVGCYHILLDSSADSYAAAVSIAGNYGDAFPAYYNGVWRVCVGSYTSYDGAQAAMAQRGISGTAMSASSACITVTITGTTKIIFEFDCGSNLSLAVSAIDGTDSTGTAKKAQSWFKGRSYYGAFEYTRLTGKNITVVNIVDIEDYVKGVIPYEMGPGWPAEALKAQALCARTYGAARVNNHKSKGFDLCNTTCCQAYCGTDGANADTDKAVDETAGLYVLHNGELCDTVFHSSDGGATEHSENVFYAAEPYLRGVKDNFESMVNTGYASWSFTYSADEITWILRQKGFNCGNIVSITPTYTENGNIYSLKFTDSNGKSWTFSKSNAGSILYSSSLKKYTYSQRFTVVSSDNSGVALYVNSASNPVQDNTGLYAVGTGGEIRALGNTGQLSVITASGQETVSILGSGVTQSGSSYIVSGSGWGHNVGMSQYGANAMAKLGYTYEDIIKFYYTGVSIG